MRDWNASPISHETPKPCSARSSLTMKCKSTFTMLHLSDLHADMSAPVNAPGR